MIVETEESEGTETPPDVAPAAPVVPAVKIDPIDLLLQELQSNEQSLQLFSMDIPIKNQQAEPDGTFKVSIYKLRELDSRARDTYMDFQTAKAKIADGKVVGVTNSKNMEIKLVGLSLFGPDGSVVPEAVIAKWPGSFIHKLFQASLRISGLDDKAEERAKNS